MSILEILGIICAYLVGAGFTKIIYDVILRSSYTKDVSVDRRSSIIGFLWPIALPLVLSLIAFGSVYVVVVILPYYIISPLLPKKWQ